MIRNSEIIQYHLFLKKNFSFIKKIKKWIYKYNKKCYNFINPWERRCYSYAYVINKNLSYNFITDSNNFNTRVLEITKKESLLWGLALFWFVTLQREFLFFYILIITFYSKKINSIQNKFFNFPFFIFNNGNIIFG